MLPWQLLRFTMNWEEMKILSERCHLTVTKALKCNESELGCNFFSDTGSVRVLQRQSSTSPARSLSQPLLTK